MAIAAYYSINILKTVYVMTLVAFVFISWIYRYIRNKKLIMEDYNDIINLDKVMLEVYTLMFLLL